MRDREIVGLWEAYLQVHQPKEEVDQLDEDFQGAVKGALEKGARATADFMKNNPFGKAIKPFVSPVGPGSGTVTAAQQKAKIKPIKPVGEEVENWVNSLIDEGYDLSEYTWEDMYEMYVNLDEEYDTFDAILEHLVAEGYADTNESALVIMANMSEEWREEILDEANEIMSITSPEGKNRKVNITYPSPRARENFRKAKKLRALQKRKRLNPKAMGPGEARRQADDEFETNIRQSISRLNAKPDEMGQIGSYYPTIRTDHPARKRRASGR